MTAALYRHTDRLPDGTTAYGCHTLARDGRTPVALGCGHRTPREAIAHKTPVYVSPTSPAVPESKPAASIPAGAAEAVPGQQEAPDGVLDTARAGASTDPLPVPPAGSGSLLQLGL